MDIYGYLKEKEYLHKREQLYLAVHQGLSGKFVKAFFKDDSNISSLDLDLVRSMALIMGEEFVFDHIYKNEFAVDEAIQIFGEAAARRSVEQLPKIQDLIHEQEHLRERFDLQMEFMKKEQESAKKHYQEMLEKERENMKLGQELLQARMDQKAAENAGETQKIRSDNEILQKQVNMMEEDRRRLMSICSDLKRQLRETSSDVPVTPDGEKNGSLFNWLRTNRRRKEKQERNDYIRSTIANPNFTGAQLEVILSAVKSDLPLEALEKICLPELPADNMKILMMYFLHYENDGNRENENKYTEDTGDGQ